MNDRPDVDIIRSWLIAPANRPDYLAKFPRLGADCSVIDLEDGTPEPHKASARDGLATVIAGLRAAGMGKGVQVRVNHPRSPYYLDDVRAAAAAGADSIAIPKLGTVEELRAALGALAEGERRLGRKLGIVGGIESAMGVIHCTEIAFADPRMIALYFGAEDFAADICGRRTPRGDEVYAARSMVVMAAKAAGLVAIDQAVVDIRNDALFLDDAARGRDLGYDGKICVTPGQVKLAHRAFSPTADEREQARRLVAAYEEATARGIGTIDFEGRMIDGPLLKRAQQVLALPVAEG